MALVVETGAGLSNADAYISLADADAYHMAHGKPSKWLTSSEADREDAIVHATLYLDDRYIHLWKGVRAYETQALAWPRSGVYDQDEYLVSHAALPARVANATAEAALRHLTETDGLMPDVSTSRAVVREKTKVGPIEEEIEYAGTKPTRKKFSKVDALLAPYLESVNTLFRA